jgi:hypothetical protein
MRNCVVNKKGFLSQGNKFRKLLIELITGSPAKGGRFFSGKSIVQSVGPSIWQMTEQACQDLINNVNQSIRFHLLKQLKRFPVGIIDLIANLSVRVDNMIKKIRK